MQPVEVLTSKMGPRYECDKCDSTYASRQGLYRHKQRGHMKVRYECGDCNSTYAHRQSLWKHRQKQHPLRVGSGIDTQDLDAQDDDDDGMGKYVWKRDELVNKQHSPLLPKDIRAIIVGKSGAGKSVLLAYLLLEDSMLDYDNLSICGPSLHQPLYRIMNKGFSMNLSKAQVRSLFENQDRIKRDHGTVDNLLDAYSGRCKGGIDAQFVDDVNVIPDPSEFDDRKKNVLVVDDVLLGPQNKIEDMYTRGRHNCIDTFYVAQNYFKIPRGTVRENANMIFMFSQDMKNLNHIYNDHCSGDGISCEQFRDFCSRVWRSGKYRYVVIDLSRDASSGKYRSGLDDIWTPDQIKA